MKKYISILFVLCCSISLLIFPQSIYAENSTYFIAEQCTPIISYGNGETYRLSFNESSEEGRIVQFKKSDTSMSLYVISKGFFRIQTRRDTGTTCSLGGAGSSSIVVNGVRYYYWISDFTLGGDRTYIHPMVQNSNPNTELAVYYTFGEGAIAPYEPVNWGLLSNVGYKTSIAGSNTASLNNRDTITWNPNYDTLGNEFTEDCKVEIRIVPGQYSASDKESLLLKTYHDFVKDLTHSQTITTLDVSAGSYSLTWNEAIQYLNRAYPFKDSSILSLFTEGNSWIKKGWIYQYRLIADNFEGDWNDIYTLTSSGVKNDLKIVNIVNIDNDVVTVVTDITEIDVDIDVVIIYDDIIIPYVPTTPTPDPSASPEPVIPDSDNVPWWVYLLNAILDLIRSISEGITSIITSIINAVSDIMNGILNLFRIDNFQIPDIELHMNEIGNGNILGFPGLVVNGLPGIMSALPTNSFVIHFPGISLMNVQLIQEMYIDLESYLTALGISHEFMYTCTDGTVYTCLAWLLGRRIIWWLRR